MRKTVVILLFCTGFLSSVRLSAAVFIDPSNPNIQYMGRWNHSDPNQPKIAWQGGAITVNFDGTGIAATLDADDTADHWEVFRVVIDDDYTTTYTFSAGPTPAPYTLATGLPAGIHKLVLMKETYWWNNSVFHGFEVTGSGLVAPPPVPALKLECFGDSNAAGDNIASEDNSSGTGQYFTFPFIAARALDARMHNLSTSGETISGGHNKYDRWDWYNENPHWDFTRYTPDAVIVNLGANDVVAGASVDKIKNDYNAFLDDLRSTYPNAHICLMNGFGWSFNETANYTDEVINARIALGDSNLSYLHFPWVFGEWHGCEYDHAGMARYLVEHLENELEITAPNPIDVMGGFGKNGNVANGSFEEIAPFGGWGWRKHVDPDNNRIYDPVGAKDGDHYLSLKNRAKSFQTIPASSGDKITVTAWMRGENNGDQADITIDFRDQGMGGIDEDDKPPAVPITPHTETKTLTTGWTQYSIIATAPTTGNPIFGTRTTFTAGSGDTVYIDDIQTFNFSFDLDDLNEMAETWLSSNAQWDIAPWPEGDGTVNIKDFSLLTNFWEY